MASETLNQTGTYELTASSQDSPMPEHSENGTGKKCAEISFKNSYTGKQILDKQSNHSIKTGDQINRFIWITLGISALVVFILVCLKRNLYHRRVQCFVIRMENGMQYYKEK